MAEKKLTHLIDKITEQFNARYNTNFTADELEPVIRFQWRKIYEAFLVQEKEAFIKLPNLCQVKLRPIKSLRRHNRLKKMLKKTPKTARGQLSHKTRWAEVNRLRSLLNRWMEIRKDKDNHYKEHYLKHPDADPITFENRLYTIRYGPKKDLEGEE